MRDHWIRAAAMYDGISERLLRPGGRCDAQEGNDPEGKNSEASEICETAGGEERAAVVVVLVSARVWVVQVVVRLLYTLVGKHRAVQ